MSQSVYAVRLPLMAAGLTSSPSNTILVSIKYNPEARLNQNLLFQNLRRDKDKLAHGGMLRAVCLLRDPERMDDIISLDTIGRYCLI